MLMKQNWDFKIDFIATLLVVYEAFLRWFLVKDLSDLKIITTYAC